MKLTRDEIFFTSRKEALGRLPWLRELGFTLYQCDRCGLNFASKDPDTDTGGIICNICVGEVR